MKKFTLLSFYILLSLFLSNVFSREIKVLNSFQTQNIDSLKSKISKGKTDRYAFLIGNNSAIGLKKLQYVENDLKSMRQTLKTYCGIKDNNIISEYNAEPEEITFIFDSLYDFHKNISKESMFLFYYSGHADKDNLLMGEKKFSFFRLKRALQSLPFKINIYIIDACHSGGFSLKGSSPDSSFLPAHMDHIIENNIEGKILIYSSTIQQKSYESSRYKNSIFTYHFINALHGAADFSKDNRISLDEAYTYAFKNTVSENDSLVYQMPGRQIDIRGEGDIILAHMHKYTSGISLDKSITGKLLIIDKYGKLVGEIYKEIGNKLLFALKAGKYKIINTKEKSSFFTKVRITKKGFTLVNRPDLTRKLKNNVKLGITLSGSATNLLSSKHTTFNPQCGIELIIRNHFQWYSNVGFVKYRNITKLENTSQQIDDIAGISYQSGIGCNFKPKFVNKFWFQSGIDVFYLNNEISYQLSSQSSVAITPYKGSNILILPHIKISFKYPISSFLDIGAKVIYHPGINLKSINDKENQITQSTFLNFMSNGYDIGLQLTYTPPIFRNYE